MEKPKNIGSIFEAAMEGPYVGKVAKKVLSITAVADLYTILEKRRHAVGSIFIHPSLVPELNELVGGKLEPWESALPGVGNVHYIGTAWGADFYTSETVPKNEVIAVTALKLRTGEYGVAKLTLK